MASQKRLFDLTLKYYKPAICLPELDDQVWATPQGQELIAEMKKKNMVTLADLLEGKVEQKSRIDLDEIYYIGAAAGMESQEHGDFPPPPPRKIWVRLSDVIEQPTEPVDRRRKLTPRQVNEMRQAKGEVSMRQLAKRYQLSVSTVSNIIHGRIWKNVP